MGAFEFRIEHRPSGTRMGPMNERLEGLVDDGWEPIFMTGDNELYIMMRRQKKQAVPQPVQAAQAAAAVPMPVREEG